MIEGMSWEEARGICEEHADDLVGTHWPELVCPRCVTIWVRGYEFSEGQVAVFVKGAWRRQREGERPFSRGYWLERAPFYGSRGRYDALVALLGEIGAVQDRKGRSSGRLMFPPKTVVRQIKRWYAPGPPGQSGQSGEVGSRESVGGANGRGERDQKIGRD